MKNQKVSLDKRNRTDVLGFGVEDDKGMPLSCATFMHYMQIRKRLPLICCSVILALQRFPNVVCGSGIPRPQRFPNVVCGSGILLMDHFRQETLLPNFHAV
jgi:hypothetical protein